MRTFLIALFLCSAASIAFADGQIAILEPPSKSVVVLKPPPVIHTRPRRLSGTLTIGDSKFDYASGGSGWSIPYGDYPITPDDVGDWGKRHRAIGINNNTIADPQLGRDREGIEIHGADSLRSAGCVVVDTNVFDKLSHMISDLIKKAGQAFLHVGPTGAAITAAKDSPLPAYVYLPEKVGDKEEEHSRHHHAERGHRHHQHHEKRVHYAHHRHHAA